MGFITYVGCLAVIMSLPCHSMDKDDKKDDEESPLKRQRVLEDFWLPPQQLEELGRRSDIITENLKRSIAIFGVIKDELTVMAREAFSNNDLKLASELAVQGSGLKTLTSMASLIIQNLKDKNYVGENDKQNRIPIQNTSLAVIGSVTFKDQLGNFIRLIKGHKKDVQDRIDLKELENVVEIISRTTSNISSEPVPDDPND